MKAGGKGYIHKGKAKSKASPPKTGGASVKEDKAPPAPRQSKASHPLEQTVLESMLPPVKKAKAELPTEKMPPMASGQPSGTAEPLPKPSAEPSAEPSADGPTAEPLPKPSGTAETLPEPLPGATSPSAKSASDTAAMPPPAKGAPVRVPDGLVSPVPKPPPPVAPSSRIDNGSHERSCWINARHRVPRTI